MSGFLSPRSTMNPIAIDNLDDQRLVPFRNLRAGTRPEDPRQHSPENTTAALPTASLPTASLPTGAPFVVEGRWLVERLIQSEYEITCVVIEQGRERGILDQLHDGVPVFTLTRQLVGQLVGFDFHRGVLAAAKRPMIRRIDELTANAFDENLPRLALAAMQISDKENLGSMLRSAAALGVNRIVLGPGTVDPFARRVTRVSMGAVFKQTFFQMKDPIAELRQIESHGFTTVAASLGSDSHPIHELTWPGDGPAVLLMGNEAHGLPDAWQEAATYRVNIPMRQSTDSLNVAVASAILMYELTNRINTSR